MKLKFVVIFGIACWIIGTVCLTAWWQVVNSQAFISGEIEIEYDEFQRLLDSGMWLMVVGTWCVFIPIIFQLGSLFSHWLQRTKSKNPRSSA